MRPNRIAMVGVLDELGHAAHRLLLHAPRPSAPLQRTLDGAKAVRGLRDLLLKQVGDRIRAERAAARTAQEGGRE